MKQVLTAMISRIEPSATSDPARAGHPPRHHHEPGRGGEVTLGRVSAAATRLTRAEKKADTRARAAALGHHGVRRAGHGARLDRRRGRARRLHQGRLLRELRQQGGPVPGAAGRALRRPARAAGPRRQRATTDLVDQAREGAASFMRFIAADPDWERLFFDFSSYAMRNEAFRAELVARRGALREGIAHAAPAPRRRAGRRAAGARGRHRDDGLRHGRRRRAAEAARPGLAGRGALPHDAGHVLRRPQARRADGAYRRLGRELVLGRGRAAAPGRGAAGDLDAARGAVAGRAARGGPTAPARRGAGALGPRAGPRAAPRAGRAPRGARRRGSARAPDRRVPARGAAAGRGCPGRAGGGLGSAAASADDPQRQRAAHQHQHARRSPTAPVRAARPCPLKARRAGFSPPFRYRRPAHGPLRPHAAARRQRP